MVERMRRVVFDFDGVVCDSTDEVMVTSWNAWEQWEGRTGFRRSVDEFSAADCAIFRAVRPRVRGAGEYYVVRRALSEGIPVADQPSYDELQHRWREHLVAFRTVFFAARERLRRENLDQWIDLHPVYGEVIAVMRTLHSHDCLYIATMKDGESVRLILERHGLTVPIDRMLDESQITSKLEALDRFREQLGCGKADLLFVDDNVTHLLQPQAAGYPVLMTIWGNQMQEYLDLAAQHHIPLLSDCTQLLLP